MSIFGRAIAYVVLAVALLAAAVALNDRKYPCGMPRSLSSPPPRAISMPSSRGARRIGLEAADAACKAAWEANRNRFFRSGKPYQDSLIDTSPPLS